MAKVLTFSRYFPAYHPKAGEPTYFVEKMWKSLEKLLPDQFADIVYEGGKKLGYLYVDEILSIVDAETPKFHTIRGGNRFKAGDFFKPVFWGNDINPKSGRSGPYHSKQIQFAPLIEVKKTWDFTLTWDDDVDEIDVRIGGKWFCQLGAHATVELAKNDGLYMSDFIDWFVKKKFEPFSGQIICWDESINY